MMERLHDAGAVARTLRAARKIVVLLIGSTVLLIGVALIILPGPAFVVIPLGLGILSTSSCGRDAGVASVYAIVVPRIPHISKMRTSQGQADEK